MHDDYLFTLSSSSANRPSSSTRGCFYHQHIALTLGIAHLPYMKAISMTVQNEETDPKHAVQIAQYRPTSLSAVPTPRNVPPTCFSAVQHCAQTDIRTPTHLFMLIRPNKITCFLYPMHWRRGNLMLEQRVPHRFRNMIFPCVLLMSLRSEVLMISCEAAVRLTYR